MTAFSRRQIAWLTLLAWIFVVPLLINTGTNVVTDTYERASHHFQNRTNLYQAPGGKGDWFKYSPFFALAYSPFTWLTERGQVLAWALLNAFVFWWGITRWFLFQKKSSWWMWAALLLVAMELNGSLRYQQINALMTGLILLGLASLRDLQEKNAGTFLALAANLKILPALIAGALLVPLRKRYAISLIWTSLVLLALPFFWLGWNAGYAALLSWAKILLGDLGIKGLIDIQTVLASFGWPTLGYYVRLLVLFGSIGFLFWLRWTRRVHFPWGLWFTVAAGCMLLCSPRSESPTFVLIAPAYLFLVHEALKLPKHPRIALLSTVAVCAFFITFCFSDLWPKAVWDPRGLHHATKTLGTLVLWSIALAMGSLRRSSSF